MKISIITVAYNSGKTIGDTIESVLSQSYKNIEYIVIDGNSTDNTMEIVKSFKNKFNNEIKYISEPDKGIYDAMNKGIDLAEGNVIGILNSDDFYESKDTLKNVMNAFSKHKVDSVFGDLIYVNAENISNIVRFWKSKPYKNNAFRWGWHPAHPTLFIKQEVYKKFGNFNTNYSIAADYELMLRFIEKHKITSHYLPQIIVRMRMGGKSNQNIKNIIKSNIECYKAWKKNDLKISVFQYMLKVLGKITQYWKHSPK